MKKPQTLKFFLGLSLFFMMTLSFGLQAAQPVSVNSWPDKEKSIRIIYQMIQQTKTENTTLARNHNSRTQVKLQYLMHLTDVVKGTNNSVETSFENNHARHVDQSNLTQAEIDTYNTIREEIEAYVAIAG